MGEFNSVDHYIYYCGQESLRRNGVAMMVNKRVQNAVLGCSLKNDRMISVRFQGKPFNIIVSQAYVPTSNIEEAEAERFYEDLQDLLELTPKKDALFITGDWNAKGGSHFLSEHLPIQPGERAELSRGTHPTPRATGLKTPNCLVLLAMKPL